MANIYEKLAVMNVLKDWGTDTQTALTLVTTAIDNINIADSPAFCAAVQSPTGAENLTLTATPIAVPRKLTLTSLADCSGVTFDFTGADQDGNAQTELSVTGPNIGTVATTKYWTSITIVAASGACTGISVGIGELHSDPVYAALLAARTFRTSGAGQIDLNNSIASIATEATA